MKQLKTVLAILIVLLSVSSLYSQALYDVAITEKDGTWEAISGTEITGTRGDDLVSMVTLPFTFRLDETNYTQIYVSTNGYLSFGYNNPYYYYYPGYYYGGNRTVGWGYGDEYTEEGITWVTTGASPNRVTTFQWNSCRIPYHTTAFKMWAQIKLYETTNKIEIIYGPRAGTPVSGYNRHAFIAGRYIVSYGPAYNINPGTPSKYVKGYPTYETGYTTAFILPDTWNTYLYQGKTYIYGKSDPELVGSVPDGGEVYRKGQIYGGAGDPEKHPAVYVKRGAGMPAVFANYRIWGPVGGSNIIDIYRAKDGGTGTFDVNMGNIIGDSARYNFTVGTGIAFGTSGVLDFQTNGSIEPGEYNMDASMTIVGVGTVNLKPARFNIALPWDIAVKKIFRPRDKFNKKYPLDEGIMVTVEVANFGLNSVTNFELTAEIFDKNGTRVFNQVVEWENTTDSLKSAESVDINMGIFYPETVGDYTMESSVEMIGPSDQLLTNNIIPRIGDDEYVFAVSKEIDLRALSIVYPSSSSEIVVGRPMQPVARFTNQGVNDVDNDTIYYEIRYQNNEVVFRDTVVNYVISAGARFDTTDVKTIRNFIPPYLGTYTICAVIYSPYDNNSLATRTICSNFNVSAGLLGNYTIGSGTGAKNFPTIQAAVDALYHYGVAGNVNFELKDRGPYVIGDLYDPENPALDLSGHITGLGPNALVTFKPSNDRAVERGATNSGVTIHVQTGSGLGILLGQNARPNNINAIVLSSSPSEKNKFAKQNGYIVWDGGQNKSIRFVLKTATDIDRQFHSVFYLKEGAQNNQIKNCIFENDYKDGSGNKRTLHVHIPKAKTSGTEVEFMPNDYSSTGYSAAIAMRTLAPADKDGMNIYNLDTIPINNNVISGNEISGFGYGVVDLGAGALLREQHNQWVKYYNNNNTISNNIIKDAARAGIFLGYTDNETIKGNRILNISGDYYTTLVTGMQSKGGHVQAGSTTDIYDAAGIMAGGETVSGWNGFNNINLKIDGNEISNIQSLDVAYGVKVEQVKTKYGASSYFPDVKENTKVINNIIWGMVAKDESSSASRMGIRLFTERTALDEYLTAENEDYFTWDDRVLSNTVIIPDDGGSTSGAIAGIAVQHGIATKILNNAVAIEDVLIDAGSPFSALIFYQGLLPSEVHGLESNRNAFYRNNPDNENGPAVFGFVELNNQGDFIEPISENLYDQNGYESIRQWRNWTGQDMNSVFGDFTEDLTVTGTQIPYLRVTTPRPFGSVLNDRGFRLHEHLNNTTSGYTVDALNASRGVNGQLFDIGAQEFEGQAYLSDVEFVMISSPAAYKSGSGLFDDAEHIMTNLPLQLKVILRNSGTMFQAATKVRLTVRDLDVDTEMRYYDTVETDIVVAQSKEVIFDIPNTLVKTFSDLEDLGFSPVVPSRFDPNMRPNVTPRYSFSIEVQADENNVNNYGDAVLRFYIRKANNTLMLISAENSNANIYDLGGNVRTTDEIAGRLNYEALKEAFDNVGWYPGIKRDIDHPGNLLDSSKVDVFDRLAWEPKAVDYRMYKYVFWSDRNDVDGGSNKNSINRYQQWDIQEFLDEGTTNNKRNMVIASQEAVRHLDYATTDPSYDEKSTQFVNDYMRSMRNGDGFAFGIGNDAHGKTIKGVSIGRDLVHTITRTGASFDYNGTVVTDENPYPGTVKLFTEGEGLALESFMYPQASANPDKQKSGMSVTTLKKNFVYIGLDWRHFDNVERVLRALIDYYDKNGGTDVPVELANFDAKANGNRVEVTWATASEFNTAKFEIERAEMNDGVKTSFFKVADKPASGTSNVLKEYGPIVDKNVVNGKTYIYRLKVVDLDGQYEFSDEKMVEIGGQGLWLGEAMPNPAKDVVKFDLTVGDNTIEVWLYDMNGSRINTNYNVNDGVMELDLTAISSGLYTLILKSGDVMMTRQFQVVK